MNLLDKPTISGTTVVAKLGGSVLQKEELLNSFVEDVQMLAKSGVSIAIVHGGGPAINEKLASLSKAPLKVQGLRVTDAETLAIVDEVISSINDLIVEKISAAGLPADGYKPSSNAMFVAEKLYLKGIE
ncbi:MAG: hypothetical protein K2X81_16550, partial [Candidatus Obscuribacterales bacterium]|nr:hypothetical protein [Candidatus Obscuribacterales bacterium]